MQAAAKQHCAIRLQGDSCRAFSIWGLGEIGVGLPEAFGDRSLAVLMVTHNRLLADQMDRCLTLSDGILSKTA